MERNPVIDYLKGIGIILVVLGHYNNFILRDYIYTFHMPLFFFISGYLHKIEKKNIDFLKRKKKLIYKYLKGSIYLFIFWVFIGRKFGETAKYSSGIKNNILGIFYGNTNGYIAMDWGVQMWFIPTLICCGYIFNMFLNNRKHILNNIILIGGLLILYFSKIKYPFVLETIIWILPFYFIGYLIKEKKIKIKYEYHYCFIGILCTIVAYVKNGGIDVRTVNYGNIIYFYLGAFSMIYVLLFLVQRIKNKELLKKIGTLSLEIMIFHLIILKFIKGIYIYGFSYNPENSTIIFPIINMILQIIVIIFINKLWRIKNNWKITLYLKKIMPLSVKK